MRGGKEEEKQLQPMFPRLHVNDTEKGGPRAPPRNKMALYEQLSVPSQRLNCGLASMMALPHNKGGSAGLVPSMSSSHGGGCERSVVTPSNNSPTPSFVAEKHSSKPSSEVKMSSTVDSHDGRRPKNVGIDHTLNITRPFPSTSKSSLVQLPNFTNMNKFAWKKFGNGNNFEPLSSAKLGAPLNSSNSQHGRDRENQPWLDSSVSIQSQSSPEKQKKGTVAVEILQERDYRRKQTEENSKASMSSQDRKGRSTVVLLEKGESLKDTPASTSNNVRSSGLLMQAQPSTNWEQRGKLVDSLKPLCSTDEYHEASQSCQDPKERSTMVQLAKQKTIEDTLSNPSEKVRSTEVLKQARPSSNWEQGFRPLNQQLINKETKTLGRVDPSSEAAQDILEKNASKLRIEFSLDGGDKRSPNRCENGGKHNEYKKDMSFPTGFVQRHNASQISMLDCVSALDVTPDDVVGTIGEKQFWEVRNAIINQQRVFAVQVFELHRLTKIQKLIAASPHVLLDGLCMGKASLEVSPGKKVPAQYAIEQSTMAAKPIDCSQKPNPSGECVDENAVWKPSVPSSNNETCKQQQSSFSTFPASVTNNSKSTPWCFPPPGNQWLVPTMSPSEGLIYKPYMGPCPPTAGFMAPVYGGYGPMSLTPSGGDFLNLAYGVPASHQQGIGILPGQTYFPQYGMPITKPLVSGSTVEQMSPFTGSDNQLAIGDLNFAFLQQGSCNMSSQMSRVIPSHVPKLQVSKESEVQGSTASSPSERGKGDAFLLFPTEPTIQVSDLIAETNEPHTRVIKVVPHNPTSATESAARIFKRIQEERKRPSVAQKFLYGHYDEYPACFYSLQHGNDNRKGNSMV